MPNPTAAMLVIGDEILSGRTRDANMHHLAGKLTEVGIDFIEARVISDRTEAIVAALNELRERADYVFTSGGIGPTHDDITADAVAEAFGVRIGVRDDARQLLETYYAERNIELNQSRLRMARIPDGATLIENPVSVAPGFVIGNVHVMAGVPSIFEAMLASVLPTLTGGAPLQSRTIRIERGEGDVARPLSNLAEAYPDLMIGSYPFMDNGIYGANVVLRGTDPERLQEAEARLLEYFEA
ncbi:competence/damage-inducible protein A [Histidinibacterium aquaticum]|uniref:Competence/damage-inducible protein A n=1 Tax=Histidinibacterium aquaticum TaxID=2613962 RepID=A0A5J5GH99_9RHOB|nr:molybdopterin-binding protein [Histidinibacterium aquaticum]KAA9007098.1 competence/damage-inducible protein A [Histidinibacterium aquaticum]